jgi:hypothetical protein
VEYMYVACCVGGGAGLELGSKMELVPCAFVCLCGLVVVVVVLADGWMDG